VTVDDANELTLTYTDLDIYMGRFYSPAASNNENSIVFQDIYISANFTIDTFSVDVKITDDDGIILSVTPVGDVEYTTLSNKEVRIYYEDQASPFCSATGDNKEKIATVKYRVSCPPSGAKISDSGPGGGSSVTISTEFNDESIVDMVGETAHSHFVDIDPHNVTGTCGGGIINPPIERANDDGAIPDEFALLSNRPNPFNPSTHIAYNLPTASQVLIEVYNITGQRVKTLVNEYKAAGRHEVSWNGTDEYGRGVSTGIYLYRMMADGFQDSKKMILMK
jgi:hypothetical protein